ncbi:hypothetical protein [Vibrio neptunius]
MKSPHVSLIMANAFSLAELSCPTHSASNGLFVTQSAKVTVNLVEIDLS